MTLLQELDRLAEIAKNENPNAEIILLALQGAIIAKEEEQLAAIVRRWCEMQIERMKQAKKDPNIN